MSEKFNCAVCGKPFDTEKGKKIHEARCTLKEEPKEEPEKKAVTSAGLEKKALNEQQAMKEYLDSQPKTTFHIPLEDGESEGSYASVQINGYTYQIRKGELVNIPLPVAELLANKYKVQMEAGKDMLLNRKSDVAEALN